MRRPGGSVRPKSSFRGWCLATALLAVLLVGCAARLQKPEISLAGVNLVGLGLVEQRLLLRLRVVNPNDVELPIKALDFELELNGRPFAKGASGSALVVAQHSEGLLEVDVRSRLGDVLRELREARSGGQLAYRIHGRVELAGTGTVPFERSGQLPLAALDRFAPK
jgi:LEA14-like dessication related protein